MTTLDSVLAYDPAAARWESYAGRFEQLQAASLTPDTVPGWLQAWSDLEGDIGEVSTALSLRADMNTADAAAQEAYETFIAQVPPQAERAAQGLSLKLLAVEGYVPSPDEVLLLRRVRDRVDLYREANVELGARHESLMNRYGTITGNMTVKLDGEDVTVPAAEAQLSSPDRARREEAWRALQAARMDVAPQLDALMQELLPVRAQLARNADLPDFRAYMWRVLDRVDYTPEECLEFHDAVEREVVPLVADLMRGRRKLIGDTLRPWDAYWRVPLDLSGEPPRPFRTVQELEDVTERVFTALDPELGEQFRNMRGGYLDLGSRPNKMSHAYCASFPRREMPFVLMNVVGSSSDVRVLLHEMGHAFHGLASMRAQRLTWNTWSPIEFVEVPSQAMELLALPHLGRESGGFYTPEELTRVRREQLEGVLMFLPWAAQMDAFQHWLYTQGEDVTTERMDAQWLSLHRRFQPHADITGFEAETAKGWQYYHVFRAPFYYVEYAFCWLGALGLWRAALQDPRAALQRYKAALRLGSTRSVPELYEAAGTQFRFDRGTVGSLARFAREQLDQ